MFDLLVILQVLVTLLIVPIFSFKRFKLVASNYVDTYCIEAKEEVSVFIEKSKRTFFITVFTLFIVGLAASLYTVVKHVELFTWDNQAGLVVLFLLAMIPVIVLSLEQKNLLNILKSYSGGIRTASLSPLPLRALISKPLLLILVSSQFVFVGTIFYFINHPFDGFAGYTNFIGLVLLDGVFGASMWAIYHSKKLNAIQIPAQRNAIKIRAIRINTLIWILAVFQVSLSMWISGFQLESLKLITQSIYLQLILLLTAFTLALPKPSSHNEPS